MSQIGPVPAQPPVRVPGAAAAEFHDEEVGAARARIAIERARRFADHVGVAADANRNPAPVVGGDPSTLLGEPPGAVGVVAQEHDVGEALVDVAVKRAAGRADDENVVGAADGDPASEFLLHGAPLIDPHLRAGVVVLRQEQVAVAGADTLEVAKGVAGNVSVAAGAHRDGGAVVISRRSARPA